MKKICFFLLIIFSSINIITAQEQITINYNEMEEIETLIKEAPQIAERMINNIQLIKPGLWIVGFNIWLPMTDTASDALLNV